MALVDFSYDKHVSPHVFFSGRVCHDLNNIITTAMGAVSLLQFKAPMESTFRGELDRLDRSIEALSQFTKRIERVFLDSFDNRIPYNLTRLIKMTIDEFQSPKLEIRFDGDSVRPSAIDVSAVQSMIKEILTNSIDSMAGEGVIDVSLRQLAAGGSHACQLTIADSGKGIAEDNLSEVFGAFKSFEKRGNLVGLGLAYVGSVVHHHGWSMAIESELDKGTKIHISIPLEPAP